MAQKRISRARKRDLEQPDEFLTLTSRILGKISTHWKPLSAGFGAIMAIVMGIMIHGYFGDMAEDKAFTHLNQTMRRYASEVSRQDTAKALDAIAPEFEVLFSKYGNRQGGLAGRMIFAQMNYQAGRIEEAIAQYKAAEKGYSDGSFSLSAAQSGLGYALAAAGQDDEAIAAFSQVLGGPDPVLKADAYYQLALLFRKTGQDAEYRESIQNLRETYPTFMYAELFPEPK